MYRIARVLEREELQDAYGTSGFLSLTGIEAMSPVLILGIARDHRGGVLVLLVSEPSFGASLGVCRGDQITSELSQRTKHAVSQMMHHS